MTVLRLTQQSSTSQGGRFPWKSFLRVAVLLVLGAVTLSAPHAGLHAQIVAPRPVPEATADDITASDAADHIEFLASDEMMGRDTPSPWLDTAARYIENEFRKYGLEPVNGSYYHQYRLKREDLGTPNTLKVNGRKCKLKDDFIPYEFSASGGISGDVVFAGYGISRPDLGYDDYAGIDVSGKVVVVIAGTPARFIPKRPGAESLADQGPRDKMRVAVRHGAAGLLILSNPARNRFVRPGGYSWRALYPGFTASPIPIKLDLPSTETAIPAAGIGIEIAQRLFGKDIQTIGEMVKKMDSTGAPASRPLNAQVDLEVTIQKTVIPARNVIGVVRGSRFPDEYVVIGAHYDHVGYFNAPSDAPASEREDIDTIYNGADDNASGTSALLLNARAFGSLPLKDRPARSILFIAFSGEEKGLYGSRAYIAEPSVPVERMAAMLNMDMIGRNHRDSVSVGGGSRSSQLAAMVVEANRAEPMKLVYDLEDMLHRSDQASFMSRSIPVVFLSAGQHADYHRVTDEIERINKKKVAHIARLCFRIAWLVAESPQPPAWEAGAEPVSLKEMPE